MQTIRLNHFLAKCGVGSRRKCDEFIAAGKVMVNGETITRMGVQINPEMDVVVFEGRAVRIENQLIYILLNKPLRTVTTTSDEKRRKTVLDVVNIRERIYPVGRLDFNTTGALLLTNDGDMAFYLAHPRFEVSKIYRVLLDKRMRPIDLHHFGKGLDLGNFVTAPCRIEEVRVIDNRSYLEVEIHEGKNRQLRRMFDSLNYQVSELERIEFAGLRLQSLKPGEWRFLTPKELQKLRTMVESGKHKIPGEKDTPQKEITIAIDGPAASGKSTTARAVANKLGYVYIDSGAMYRAVTLKALETGVNVKDVDLVARIAESIDIAFKKDNEKTIIYLDGKNVSDEIRAPQIDRNISPVAANPKVREILVKKQQKMGQKGGVVMDGRDIGTVVFPNAELKIFMVAGVEERARRRKKEQAAKGIEANLGKIMADIHYRDQQDKNRTHGPLKRAPDAVEVDTTNLSIKQQVEKILMLAADKMSTGSHSLSK